MAAAIIAADQWTKLLIRANLAVGDRIPIIGDWMRIAHVQNYGAAFSMFSGNRWITVVLTSVLILLCVILAIREIRSGSKLLAMCLTWILAGGIGNMIDRLTQGYVTDMISCGSFAVFNVADIFVTCGCILAAVYVIFFYKEEPEKKDETKCEGVRDE